MRPIASLFHAWERRLAFADDHERRVLPFEWGTEFLDVPIASPDGTRTARDEMHRGVDWILDHSDRYFEDPEVSDYRLDDDLLAFTSGVSTESATNNRVRARYFPVADAGPAVLVLPQWNAKTGAQEGLCRLLNRFGLASLKLALPYHEQRKPEGLQRADFMLSPNVGRTLESCRQAVQDARAATRWLVARGHAPVGVVGTSLGSCIAFITAAHESRVRAAVFNHISPYFADVVWRGISTRQVRSGLEAGVDLDELRRLWMPLSPFHYYARLKRRSLPSLLIHARYDLSFPVDLSMEVLRDFRQLGIDHETQTLPCGHYSTGKFPFNWMDGLSISRFLARQLFAAEAG